MGCGCTETTTGDCADALTPIRVCTIEKIYAPPNNTDPVDGELLVTIIQEMICKINAQAELLATLINADCTVKDGVCPDS